MRRQGLSTASRALGALVLTGSLHAPIGCEASVRQKRRATVRKASAGLARQNTQRELDKLRRFQTQLYEQWEADEEGWRELPARAWPAYQPDPAQLHGLQQQLSQYRCLTSPGKNKEKCNQIIFDMSTSLVFYTVDPIHGLQQYERLARQGHVDAMVACGILLVEGIGGILPREEEGVTWLQKAVELGSAQACYELGVVYYTGIDGVVEEDTTQAFALFKQAAMSEDHTAALYMMADCYLEGDGVPEKSLAKAVPLLYKAADRGHRFARQMIRELLANRHTTVKKHTAIEMEEMRRTFSKSL